MPWANAIGRGVLIVLYFVIATVWLPDYVLTLGAVAEASQTLRDLLLLGVWGVALVAGMYLLRWAQRRGLI
jgi:hypothetical protein